MIIINPPVFGVDGPYHDALLLDMLFEVLVDWLEDTAFVMRQHLPDDVRIRMALRCLNRASY